jgi:endonuclease/exonuclease/phosphatase family metal-dependent hydrolase
MGRCWCNIIFLNAHALTEDKTKDTRNSFYEGAERVLGQFPNQKMHISLGDFNAKVRTEDILKEIIGNKRLHEISNDSAVGVLHFATSKNRIAKEFPHDNINKFTCNTPEGKARFDHILIDWRRNLSVRDVRSFRRVHCDANHSCTVRERLSVNKRGAQLLISRVCLKNKQGGRQRRV